MRYLAVPIRAALYTAVFAAASFPQYQNIRVDNPASNWQPQEVAIAINPANPQNIVVGSNKKYFYYSSNSGTTWTGGTMTSQYNMCGDPCPVFDADGVCYYGFISEPPTYWPDRIVVRKSTDGGRTWSTDAGIGYVAGKNQDKEWVAVDRTASRYKGRVYVAWTQFDQYQPFDTTAPPFLFPPSRLSWVLKRHDIPAARKAALCADTACKTIIRFSFSTDKGQTWSVPVRISDTTGTCVDGDEALEGAVPAVGPNGEVYVSWAGYKKIYFDKSLDGGATFGADKIVATQYAGWAFNIPGVYRCNGMPVTCCDISSSPYRGTVYINWTDQVQDSNNTDVFMVKSADGGATWSAPKRVNDDNTTRHQFFSWMCVDEVTGYVYVVFFDRRATTGNATDVYVARSRDGGSTYENFKVSQSPFTPDKAVFFGDYSGIAAHAGKAYAVWPRMDNGNLSAWMARITEQVSLAPGRISDSPFQEMRADLDPRTGRAAISGTFKQNTALSIGVYDIRGRQIRMVTAGTYGAGAHCFRWDAGALGGGTYFYYLIANGRISRIPCVVLR
jgi:hypothetical protein